MAAIVASDPGANSAKAAVGPLFIVAYAAAMVAAWIGILTPLTVTLPLRVSEIAPGHEGKTLSLVLGLGAVTALVANPLFGKLSDGTTLKMGRRRPWLIGGQIGQFAAGALMLSAPNISVLLVGWCLMQLAFNAYLAAALALFVDQVPTPQRGMVSGVLGVCAPIGQLVGAYIAQSFSPNMMLMVVLPMVAAGVLVGPLLFVLKDRPADDALQPPGLGSWLKEFWLDPRAAPDFAWAWVSRFLFVLGLSFVITYQAHYLINELGRSPAEVPRLIFVSTLVSSAAFVVASVVGGLLSDGVPCRKVFVAGAAALFGVGLWMIAMSPNLRMFLIAMGVAGAGQGLYCAVGMALVGDVVPDPNNPAKDLGIFNLANAMPQSVAPAIAPVILALGGGSYATLFAGAGVIALLGALAILPVRRLGAA